MAYIFVNGYGTPSKSDPNYNNYLDLVRKYVHGLDLGPHTVYLCGGCTDRSDVSEAEWMRRWFDENPLPHGTKIVLIDQPIDARGNMCAVEKKHPSGAHLIVFCEYSRRWTMRFFCSRLFASWEVWGVEFDPASLRFEQRMRQLCLHLPLEVLAWHFPCADRLRRRMRAQHIERARSKRANA